MKGHFNVVYQYFNSLKCRIVDQNYAQFTTAMFKKF